MADDLSGYTLAASEVSSDGFGVQIYVRAGRELTEADHSACDEARRAIGDAIREETARLDPLMASEAAAHLASFRRWFGEAGLTPVLVEPIPNDYWPTSGAYADVRLASPWAVVTSEIGRVTIGCRKRVIEINWTDSTVKQDAPTLFPDVQDTKGGRGERYIHAWNSACAVGLLRRLADSRADGSTAP